MNTVGTGPVVPAGRVHSAWTGPATPSTHASSRATEGSGRSPGGTSSSVSVPSGCRARTDDGYAADDQPYSTVPSGRTSAPPTDPAAVGSSDSAPVARS